MAHVTGSPAPTIVSHMPGYRPLSSEVEGIPAEKVRLAEEANPADAVTHLEQALDECKRVGMPIPHWLCGRLAACYRVLRRFDDEVQLLEDYRDSQVNDRDRSRYEARLTKAQTLAERARGSDNGALASIRGIKKPRRRNVERPN